MKYLTFLLLLNCSYEVKRGDKVEAPGECAGEIYQIRKWRPYAQDTCFVYSKCGLWHRACVDVRRVK